MPTKIPSIGSSNWGQDLNNIFNDITVTTNGANIFVKPTPGIDYTNAGGVAKLDPFAIAAGDVTVYVNSSTGNDTNSGLASGSAFATLQKAIMFANTAQFVGQTITIELAAGTYSVTNASKIVIKSYNTVVVKGMGANPSDVQIVSNGILGGGVYTQNRMIFVQTLTSFENLTIKSNTGNQENEGMYVEQAVVNLKDVAFTDLAFGLSARGQGAANITGSFVCTNVGLAINSNIDGFVSILNAVEDYNACGTCHYVFYGTLISVNSTFRVDDTTPVTNGIYSKGGRFYYEKVYFFMYKINNAMSFNSGQAYFTDCGFNVVGNRCLDILENAMVDFVQGSIGFLNLGLLAGSPSDRTVYVDRNAVLKVLGGDTTTIKVHPQNPASGNSTSESKTNLNNPFENTATYALTVGTGAYIQTSIGGVTGSTYTNFVDTARFAVLDIF